MMTLAGFGGSVFSFLAFLERFYHPKHLPMKKWDHRILDSKNDFRPSLRGLYELIPIAS